MMQNMDRQTFSQQDFFSARVFRALYNGSVIIARIVWSQVQFASTPAFLNKCVKAFSPSSTVWNPLCGMTGSSGKLGLAGKTVFAASVREATAPAPVCATTAVEVTPI